jgi:hypothetical protein
LTDLGGDEPRRLDAPHLLSTFHRHDVEFVLVGGLAAGAYGAQRATNDIDIVPRWSRENLTRLAAAMRELEAGLRIGTGELLPTTVHPDLLEHTEISTWTCRYGDFDMMRRMPTERGGYSYEDLASRAKTLVLPDVGEVLTASLDDIIESKEYADRPKDHEALPELYQLRDGDAHETERSQAPNVRGPDYIAAPDSSPDLGGRPAAPDLGLG